MANEVQFTSNSNEAKKILRELERAALKDVAKFLRKEIKSTVPVGTGPTKGTLKKNVGSWVKKTSTGNVVLQIGVYTRERAQRKGYHYAFYAHMVEILPSMLVTT